MTSGPQHVRIPRLGVLVGALALAIACALASASSGARRAALYGDSAGAGRFVVFDSTASGLALFDSDATWDVFLRDRDAGTTSLLSLAADGRRGGDSFSVRPAMSSDGRFVTFVSDAKNLVPEPTTGVQTYVRDLETAKTELVSVALRGAPQDAQSLSGQISADGRFVTFESGATNLVAEDANGRYSDIFVRDRQARTTELASVSSDEEQGSRTSQGADISEDGRYVVFTSDSTNLVVGDANGLEDVFVRDRGSGTTELVSLSGDEQQGNGSIVGKPEMSANGRYVAFASTSSNLVPGDTNQRTDIFVRDRVLGTTERVSISDDERELPEASGNVSASADFRFIAFTTTATNVVPGDTNALVDVFVRDRVARTTRRVSLTDDDRQADGRSHTPTISADGRFVVFTSTSANLTQRIYDSQWGDTYIRDLVARTTEHISRPTTPARAGTLRLHPVRPRAGRPLTVIVPIRHGRRQVISAAITCSAEINGRALRVVASDYRRGVARCGWAIPSQSAGLALRGRIAASTPNGAVVRVFRLRVGP